MYLEHNGSGDLERAFQVLDKDADGLVSASDILDGLAILGALLLPPSPNAAKTAKTATTASTTTTTTAAESASASAESEVTKRRFRCDSFVSSCLFAFPQGLLSLADVLAACGIATATTAANAATRAANHHHDDDDNDDDYPAAMTRQLHAGR